MSEQEKQKYLLTFDEINMLMQASYDETADFETNVRNVTNDLYDCLETAYHEGIETVSEMLDCFLPVNENLMKQAIYQEIDGMDFRDRVYEHLAEHDVSGLSALAQSEVHRVFTTAMDDGASYAELPKSHIVTKTWLTVGDEKVRDTHSYLDSVTIPAGEMFYTIDGDSAFYPSGFERAENNVNCRCLLVYRQERR